MMKAIRNLFKWPFRRYTPDSPKLRSLIIKQCINPSSLTLKEIKLLGKHWKFVFMAKMIIGDTFEWQEDGKFYKEKMEQFNTELRRLLATTAEWVPPSKLKHNPGLTEGEPFPEPNQS